MNRNDLLDLIEEIQTRNYNFYKGLNEADLATREEIADLLMKEYENNADKMFTWDDMRKAIEYGSETDCPFLPEYIDKFYQSIAKTLPPPPTK